MTHKSTREVSQVKGCLYIKRLSTVEPEVLAELIGRAWQANHRPV